MSSVDKGAGGDLQMTVYVCNVFSNKVTVAAAFVDYA